jgi:hypothetical protein
MRNRCFVHWLLRSRTHTVAPKQKPGETMELLDLVPPDLGVTAAGLYIIDDDGLRPLAGPFASESAAIAWIVQRQDNVIRPAANPGVRHALAVQAALAV